MKININLFLIFIIFYIFISLFFSQKNFFKYLELKKINKEKTEELSSHIKKRNEIETNLELLKNKNLDYVEEVIKNKFNLKLKSEYVIYFKKKE